MTPDELRNWAMKAEPGKWLRYYHGALACDAALNPKAKEIRKAASELYMTGLFELAQTRARGPEFSYLITKRVTRDPMIRVWIRDPNKYYSTVNPRPEMRVVG